jgi:tetratricopeptide (TPR) repeat protein
LVLAGAVHGAESGESWVEVRSANFVVFSNHGENRARQVALDFELVRAVAQQAIPALHVDPRQPVLIFAVHGEDSLRELGPWLWERRGPRPAGVFQPAPHTHHIALRIDASRANRYRSVFHEYFHLLTTLNLRHVPRWLDEGLSEFWENVVIREDTVEVGRSAQHHLMHLREGLMMPLDELLATDRNPHESDPGKITVFYASSWALMHYIMVGDNAGETQRSLSVYLDLLGRNVEPLQAAGRAFGDLDQLDAALREYVRSDRLSFFRLDAPRKIGDRELSVRELTSAEALAARGTFLVYGQRPKAAQPPLAEALELDPDQPLAHESMGYLHYRQNERDEAEKWFSLAVALESSGYLSHFYSAVLTRSTDADRPARIESALRRTIERNIMA